jgi:hypothetical protein
MLTDNRDTNRNLQFIASRIYDDFNDIWGIEVNKGLWVYTWASYLDAWCNDPKIPLTAFKFCINNLNSCPNLVGFGQYCESIKSGEKLN